MRKDAAFRRHFGLLARRLREEAGYPTLRAFFDGNGGAAGFGCTLRALANIERGRSLPQPRLAERLATAMRLGFDEERARRFVEAYLRALVGGGEAYEFLVAALRWQPPPDPAAASAPSAGEGARAEDPLLDHPLLIRASESELRAYFAILDEALAAVAEEPGAEPARVELRVGKLINF